MACRIASLAATLLAAVTIGATVSAPAQAENSEISNRRAAERTSFSNDEIKEGFFKTAFHAELQFDRPAERIRKFDDAIRVFVVNRRAPDRGAAVEAVVADIRSRVNHLDFAVTADRDKANVVVLLVPEREFADTIHARYGEAQATKIQKSLRPQCLSGIAKDRSYRIRRAEVILPVDADEFTFYDCAYEELLQALGLMNDDNAVPWTMFNDDVQMGFFDVYDQFLVNILYDERIRPGMTKNQVGKLLPDILPAVHTWIGKAGASKAATPLREFARQQQPPLEDATAPATTAVGSALRSRTFR